MLPGSASEAIAGMNAPVPPPDKMDPMTPDIPAAVKRYIPIMGYISVSGLKKEAAGTFGGFLWWIGEPLIYGVIYYFIFAVVFQTRTENFVAFLLVGLTTWRWISLTMTGTGVSVEANAALMRQLHIPKVIFPLQVIVVQAFKFLLAMTVIWAILTGFGLTSLSGLIYLPFVFFVSVAFLSGAGLVLSVITPFFPDMRNINSLVFRALLFLSGVFFEASRVPEDLRPYFYLNPFVTLIESFRDVLVFGVAPDFRGNAIILMIGLVLMAAGLWAHQRLNRVFPRYLI